MATVDDLGVEQLETLVATDIDVLINRITNIANAYLPTNDAAVNEKAAALSQLSGLRTILAAGWGSAIEAADAILNP